MKIATRPADDTEALSLKQSPLTELLVKKKYCMKLEFCTPTRHSKVKYNFCIFCEFPFPLLLYFITQRSLKIKNTNVIALMPKSHYNRSMRVHVNIVNVSKT